MAKPPPKLQNSHVLRRPLEFPFGSQTLQQRPAFGRRVSRILGESEGNEGVLAPSAVFSFGDLGDAAAIVGEARSRIPRADSMQEHLFRRRQPRRRSAADSDRISMVKQLAEIKAGDQVVVLCHYAMRVWHHSFRGSSHLYGHSQGRPPMPPQRCRWMLVLIHMTFIPDTSMKSGVEWTRRPRCVPRWAESTSFEDRPGNAASATASWDSTRDVQCKLIDLLFQELEGINNLVEVRDLPMDHHRHAAIILSQLAEMGVTWNELE